MLINVLLKNQFLLLILSVFLLSSCPVTAAPDLPSLSGDSCEGNCINGHGTMLYENGDKYTGEWKNGKREGYGIFRFANGDAYAGGWQNDKKEGSGIVTLANGTKETGLWENDERKFKNSPLSDFENNNFMAMEDNSAASVELKNAVWDIAYAKDIFLNPIKATGVILFSENSQRKKAICQAFIQNLPAINTVSQSESLRVTYWLSTAAAKTKNPTEFTCDELLATYDYKRAQAILDQINKDSLSDSNKLSENDPVFVGFFGKTMVVMDGSKLSDEQMAVFIRQWMEKIVQSPTLWNAAQSADNAQLSGTFTNQGYTPSDNKPIPTADFDMLKTIGNSLLVAGVVAVRVAACVLVKICMIPPL